MAHASTNYTYDACGRPTNIGTKILTWDYEDRMTSLNGNGTYTQYGYNGVGSRVSKSNTNGSRTYKRNGVGVTAPVLSDGTATMVPGISEKPSGGGTNTILTDRLGSMKGMANAGNVTETAEFDAFGKVIAHTLPSATQKGFASGFGYQEDGESGYKLLGHRYYDPEAGRFLSRDPIGDGRNWYAYCDNNPLKAVDADGMKPEKVTKGSKYWDVVVAAIDQIGHLDPAMAEVLRNLLKKGKIYIDPEGIKRGGKSFGGESDGDTILLSGDDVGSMGDNGLMVNLVRLLLHEGFHHVHHKNRSGKECEIEATDYAMGMLKKWSKRKREANGNTITNTELDIEQAIEIEREYQNDWKSGKYKDDIGRARIGGGGRRIVK